MIIKIRVQEFVIIKGNDVSIIRVPKTMNATEQLKKLKEENGKCRIVYNGTLMAKAEVPDECVDILEISDDKEEAND